MIAEAVEISAGVHPGSCYQKENIDFVEIRTSNLLSTKPENRASLLYMFLMPAKSMWFYQRLQNHQKEIRNMLVSKCLWETVDQYIDIWKHNKMRYFDTRPSGYRYEA